MAIVMRIEAPGATTAQYERTNEIAGIGGDADAPDGLVSHVCGTTDDGILIVDVWDSEESLNRFYEARLGAALREAGFPEARPEIAKVHKMITGPADGEANVIMVIDFDAATEIYDQMAAGMESHLPGGDKPWVSHTAAVKEDGGMLIVDLWDSTEAFGTFAETQIGPAAAQVAQSGVELPPIEPRFVPVYNHIRGRAVVTA